MDRTDEEAFRRFVAERSLALVRTASLLVDDRAEDLVQVALIKTYLAWHRIRDHGAVEAYVRRTMATTAVSWWRGRRYRETTVGEPPDRGQPDPVDAQVDRDAMWQHLCALPAKQRAVLVLRFYEGLSETEIAATLNISRGAVKSHTSRALATLRRRISDDSAERGVRP